MRFTKKYLFEIILLFYVSFALLIQEDFSKFKISNYLVTIFNFSVILFLFTWLRHGFTELFQEIKLSFWKKDFDGLSPVGKFLLYLFSGSLSSIAFALAEIFSIFLLFSEGKPTHLGIPFKFLPLNGKFLVLPFAVNSLLYAGALYFYKRLVANCK